LTPGQADPQAELPLHPLEFRILLALLEGAAHGYEIVRRIEMRERYGAIYPANLYRRIRELRERNLLEDVAAPAGEDERRRQYLAITPFGRLVARAEAARLEELVHEARASNLLPT
jgi:DNA-binding PadR family transcriptional regulator